MNTLEQDIVELRKISNGNRGNGTTCQDGRIYMAKKALSVVERLQKELSDEKWNHSKAINWKDQLQEENQAYIQTLKRINSCDDSATQHSREAHEVLKRFGKL